MTLHTIPGLVTKFIKDLFNMEILAKYIHGSGDSTDVDVHYVVDALPSLAECKKFCSESKEENRNLIVINDGVVAAAYKGTVDEVNNGLLATYNLHEQEYPLLVTRNLERDLYLKTIRAVRGILSHLSRSQFRPQIKSALKGPWSERVNCIELIRDNIAKIDFDSLNNNMSGADILKLIAFQIGQTINLDLGRELYTKADIAKFSPALEPYLYRRKTSPIFMYQKLTVFLGMLKRDRFGFTENGPFVMFTETGDTYNLLTETKV